MPAKANILLLVSFLLSSMVYISCSDNQTQDSGKEQAHADSHHDDTQDSPAEDSDESASQEKQEQSESDDTRDATIPRSVSKLKWKFATKGHVSRAPMIEDGVVYCCSEDGFLYAIDLDTGEEIWKFNAHDPGLKCSPISNGDLVFVAGDDRNVYAVRKDNGWEKWNFPVGGEAAQPIIHNDTLYVGTHNSQRALAINALTGEEIWETEFKDGGIYNSPAIVGSAVAFKTDGPNVHFVKRKTGEYLGFFDKAGKKTPLFYEQNMISISGDDCTAYSLATTLPLWEFETKDLIQRTPVIHGDRLFVGSSDNSMYALDLISGSLIWQFETGGNVYCPPLVDGQSLVFGSSDERLYALDATTGEELWRYDAGHRIYSTPATSEGVVVFGCQNGIIYALE